MVLEKISTLKGATLHALDGDIGHVTDFYFDDERWTIRYVSVKTGAWLQRHHVILSIMSLLVPDWNGKRIPVRFTHH